jgi:transposase
MKPKFIPANRDQLSLLPFDLREWLPEDDFVHFVIEAVESIPLDKFKVNYRGTGDAQYHPHLMLALLIYCYSNGIFGSRRIERATHRDIAIRYLCANTHPDHDTICSFRRQNADAIAEAFLYVLQLARELKLLKVGTISVDGTKIKANASKDRNVCYQRAGELEAQLKTDIDELMKKAEAADKNEKDDQKLPDEIARREKLREHMHKAQASLEARAKQLHEQELKVYENKLQAREQRSPDKKCGIPKKPEYSVPPKSQTNLTDADSRIMRKNERSEYVQAYNAQACVDADGSQLIIGARVSQSATDKRELVANIEAIPKQIAGVHTVLADNGFASEDAVRTLQKRTMKVLVSVHSEAKEHPRKYDFRPQDVLKEKQLKQIAHSKDWIVEMDELMRQDENRSLYKKRKHTVEPTFGIIKQALGFRQFLLRGIDKVELEWLLVSTAYNFLRLFNLKNAPAG